MLSYKKVHQLGTFLGTCAFYCHRPFRKKALANLAIAFGESKTEAERKKIAILSFQNLMITCLEFFCLHKNRGKFEEIISIEWENDARTFLEKKQGVILLSAHQANWEIPFIALTQYFPGIAIGRPINNRKIYKWLLSVRQMHGGRIVLPKNAIRLGMKALSKGEFLGIVGDQAYPDSPYSYPLFGTRAWTASTPALLAYKTNCPLVPTTTIRENGRYFAKALSPILPNIDNPIKEEVNRMMDEAMRGLEASIAERPHQWMWIHDRWKQQGIDHVKREYRFGFILIILPPDPTPFLRILPIFRKIYPRSFLTFYVPKGISVSLADCAVKEYLTEKDLLVRDWRFQLVLDFYNSVKARKHFLKLGAFHALSLSDMQKQDTLEQTIIAKLVKKECLKTVSS